MPLTSQCGQLIIATKVYFSHFGDGQGFTSDIVLANPHSTDTVTGSVAFLDNDGLPLSVGVAVVGSEGAPLEVGPSAVVSSVDFSVPPLDTVTISTNGQASSVAVGSAVVSAENNLGGVVRFNIPNIGIAGVGQKDSMWNPLIISCRTS